MHESCETRGGHHAHTIALGRSRHDGRTKLSQADTRRECRNSTNHAPAMNLDYRLTYFSRRLAELVLKRFFLPKVASSARTGCG